MFRSVNVALSAAKVCRKCGTVGEETATKRCGSCGSKHNLVPLLQESTLAFLATMLPAAEPVDLMDLRRSKSTLVSKAVEAALFVSGGHYGKAAQSLGVHRNTFSRIAGPRHLRRARKEQVVA